MVAIAFFLATLAMLAAQASPAPTAVTPSPAPASGTPSPAPTAATPLPGPAGETPSPAPALQTQAPQSQPPLQNGPCLDSIRSVPSVLQAPASRAMQIVRIDQVVSTATMLPGEVIGFLYTTQDGSTWLGQRTRDYQSAADATAINRVLAATHVGDSVNEFPPTSLYGVPTKHQQLFRVQMPASAYESLRVALVPCVVWPSTRSLPDPVM
jgi:hypothetical protein